MVYTTSSECCLHCVASCPRSQGTFTEMWASVFEGNQAAPIPSSYDTVASTYRNGVAPSREIGTNVGTDYDPAVHGYPAVPEDRQTMGMAWGDYGARARDASSDASAFPPVACLCLARRMPTTLPSLDSSCTLLLDRSFGIHAQMATAIWIYSSGRRLSSMPLRRLAPSGNIITCTTNSG